MNLIQLTRAASVAAVLALAACNGGGDKDDDGEDTDTDVEDTDDTDGDDTDDTDDTDGGDTDDTDGGDTDDTMGDDTAMGDMYDLTFNATGYAPHNDQTVTLKVFDAADAEIDTQTATVTNGEFSFSWTDALMEGEDYTVRWYVDFNDNGSCDASPTDHQWEITLTNVMMDTTHDETHNTNFTDVCSFF